MSAAGIDLASHSVIGWAVADHLKTDLVDGVLTDALRWRWATDSLVFHSDRGWQSSAPSTRAPRSGTASG